MARYGLRYATKGFDKKIIGSCGVLVNITAADKVRTNVRMVPQSFNFVQINGTHSPLLLHCRSYSKKQKERNYESDSDSDNEGSNFHKDACHHEHQERGDSEFWRRKMRTFHKILDVNHDGIISFDDFLLLAKKFSNLGHLDPTEYEEFMTIMKQTWEAQWGEITPYNLVTAEQFLTDMHHALNDKDLVKKIHGLLPYFFKAVDTHNVGFLELDQFKLFYRCLGLTDEDAAVAFAVIDKNGDGKLTQKEFVKLGREFFLTEDERKVSRMFWGPLIEH